MAWWNISMAWGLLLSKCLFFVQHFKYIQQEVDTQQVGENCPQHDRFVEAHYNHPFCLVSLSGLGRWVVNPNILPTNGCRKSRVEHFFYHKPWEINIQKLNFSMIYIPTWNLRSKIYPKKSSKSSGRPKKSLASSNLISSSKPFNKRAAEIETRPSKSAFLPTKKNAAGLIGFWDFSMGEIYQHLYSSAKNSLISVLQSCFSWEKKKQTNSNLICWTCSATVHRFWKKRWVIVRIRFQKRCSKRFKTMEVWIQESWIHKSTSIQSHIGSQQDFMDSAVRISIGFLLDSSF